MGERSYGCPCFDFAQHERLPTLLGAFPFVLREVEGRAKQINADV